MQEIALVFVAIDSFQQFRYRIVFYPCIVSGRNEVAAKSLGIVQKNAELDFPITQDIWIWRASRPVLREKFCENLVPVFACKIDMVQGDIEVPADSPRILVVLGGRTVAIIIFPVSHMQALHIVAGTNQLKRCNGRIHSTGNGDDNFVSSGNLHAANIIRASRE